MKEEARQAYAIIHIQALDREVAIHTLGVKFSYEDAVREIDLIAKGLLKQFDLKHYRRFEKTETKVIYQLEKSICDFDPPKQTYTFIDITESFNFEVA